MPLGEAGLHGQADGFFQLVERDGIVQHQQSDVIVHADSLKVLVTNDGCVGSQHDSQIGGPGGGGEPERKESHRGPRICYG